MKKLIIAGMALSLLAGCTTLKRATGQIDDTVLPGQRQDILSPDQQVARDPNVQGNPPTPQANTGMAQAPVNQGQQVAGNMPRAATPSANGCDPKIDLCPEPLAPEPIAPVSPVKPVTPLATKAANTAKAGKTTVANAGSAAKAAAASSANGAKPAVVKTASKAAASPEDAANANLAAGQVLTDPNAPADATKKVVKKKVVKKKIVKKKPAAAAAAPAVPAAPDANAPAVPAAPAPQGQ